MSNGAMRQRPHYPITRVRLPTRLGTTSGSAAASTASATSAATTAVEAAAARARRLRPRFVHRERPPAEVRLIETLDGRPRRLGRGHLDERKPTGPASRLVAHHAHRLDRSRLGKHRLKIVFAGLERDVADEQFTIHVLTL